MKPTTSPYKHIFYNLNVVRKKSGEKYKKTLERYALVLKKSSNPLMARRVEKTMKKVQARLKLYGITKTMVDEYMAKRSGNLTTTTSVKKAVKKAPTKTVSKTKTAK
jgi:hypothetical protein